MLHDPSIIDYSLLVPWGYGERYKSLLEVEHVLLQHYHPEYVRRLIAWLHSKGGSIGVGGHFRPDGTQPNLPGFAAEGRSFHQNQRYNDGFIGATAVDLVAPDGPDANHSHDGVRWSDVLPQGSSEAYTWGLHCNISSELWHMQPIEIDGWSNWVKAGSPAPAPNYPLPVGPPAPPAPGRPDWGLYPYDQNKPTLKLGSTGDKVVYLQRVLSYLHSLVILISNVGSADGQFGPKTDAAVRELQAANGLAVDGYVGPNTWAVIDWVALNL